MGSTVLLRQAAPLMQQMLVVAKVATSSSSCKPAGAEVEAAEGAGAALAGPHMWLANLAGPLLWWALPQTLLQQVQLLPAKQPGLQGQVCWRLRTGGCQASSRFCSSKASSGRSSSSLDSTVSMMATMVGAAAAAAVALLQNMLLLARLGLSLGSSDRWEACLLLVGLFHGNGACLLHNRGWIQRLRKSRSCACC